MAYKHNKQADPRNSKPTILAKYEQIILDHVQKNGKITPTQAYKLIPRYYGYVDKLLELMSETNKLNHKIEITKHSVYRAP